MKTIVPVFLSFFLVVACNQKIDKEKIKREIEEQEKSFELMTREKNIAEAFYFYADENAVIKRENDTLIFGKEAIKKYYLRNNNQNVVVTWKPDFIDISDDGTIAYSFGKYNWEIRKDTTVKVFRGVFHTIWKKTKNNEWKYVWD